MVFLSCQPAQGLFPFIETDGSAYSVNSDPPSKGFLESVLTTTTQMIAGVKAGFDDFCQTLSTFCHDTKEAALIGYATVIVATEIIYDPTAVTKVPEKTEAVRDNLRAMGKYYDEHEGQIKCAAAFVAAAAVVTVCIICLLPVDVLLVEFGEVFAEFAGYGTGAMAVSSYKYHKYQQASSVNQNKGAKPPDNASVYSSRNAGRRDWKDVSVVQF